MSLAQRAATEQRAYDNARRDEAAATIAGPDRAPPPRARAAQALARPRGACRVGCWCAGAEGGVMSEPYDTERRGAIPGPEWLPDGPALLYVEAGRTPVAHVVDALTVSRVRAALASPVGGRSQDDQERT